MKNDGLRKAAILVSSLSTQEADRLLDLFPPGDAQRVRMAMVELDQIDPQEQRRVLEEFFRVRPMVPVQQQPGLELSDRLARRLLDDAPPYDDDAPAGGPAPFCFLHDAEADKLSRILSGERPQTIALVLSHLPAEQSGAVLVRLEAALQVEVIRRLVDLEETDPAILREVEHALRTRFSQQVQMQRRRVAGLKAVAGILEASSQHTGRQILSNLAARDRALADKLGPPPLEFDELVEADDDTWAEIFRAADPELVLLALVGAPPALIERVLRPMAAHEADVVRRKLDHPGPVRLSDVEEARRELAELAHRLAPEGRVELPGPRRMRVCCHRRPC